MAAFCGTCGKPLSPGGTFCGACGAQANAATPPSVAPVKSGSSALKIVVVLVLVGGAMVVMAAGGAFYFGRKKIAEWRDRSGITGTITSRSPLAIALQRHATSAAFAGSALLSKEEVGAIIGVPVTSIEMSGQSDATYKTATQGLEAGIEVERKDGEADAVQSIEAARLVTEHAFGGKGEKVEGIGDDAVYGAFNVLYVRKNDVFLTITPPNLKQAAQAAEYSNVVAQPLGSEGQRKALEKLQESMKGDPAASSLSKPDAVSGATDLIQHAAADQGDEYETKARLMARQMAEKVVAKIGT